jgi:23S rRNA pseudouridine2605 synthase
MKQRTKRTTATQKQSSSTRSNESNEPVRLNKVIADAGVASRRTADEYIAAGRVRVNGEIQTQHGIKVSINDEVAVDGEVVSRKKHLTYVLLNKPKNYITTSNDELGRATVFDLVKIHLRLFTVGRLDRNTTGVLLLTNDGELANRMMHPRYGIARAYKAVLDKPLISEHARAISHGVELEDGKTQPAVVVINPTNKREVVLEIREGKNREVRRIFENFGYEVTRLDRKQYATLTCRGLKRGEYRHLTREEVSFLRSAVKL